MTIQVKATEQYVLVVLFIMLNNSSGSKRLSQLINWSDVVGLFFAVKN